MREPDSDADHLLRLLLIRGSRSPPLVQLVEVLKRLGVGKMSGSSARAWSMATASFASFTGVM